MYGKDGIDKGWLSLIVRFPDRIMVGTDPCCGLKPRYSQLVQDIRKCFLAELPAEIRAEIAYENAKTVFGL